MRRAWERAEIDDPYAPRALYLAVSAIYLSKQLHELPFTVDEVLTDVLREASRSAMVKYMLEPTVGMRTGMEADSVKSPVGLPYWRNCGLCGKHSPL